MRLLSLALAAAVALTVAALMALVAVIPAVAALHFTSDDPEPSAAAVGELGTDLIDLYRSAASTCDGLAWNVLAGIAEIESHQGSIFGGVIGADGRVEPPIIGIALDGRPGLAAIRDTDDGRYDQDRIWDRAVGPFQFIPTSWAIYGTDANGDGVADPHNMVDAAHAAVNHLCPRGSIGDIDAAILGYNRSYTYLRDVLAASERFAAASVADASDPLQ